MRVTDDGHPAHILNQLPYEENGHCLLEQYVHMTMDGSFAMPERQVYPYTDVMKEQELPQGTSNNKMSWQFSRFSSDMLNFSGASAEYGSGDVCTNTKALSSEEIIKLAGSRYTRGSANGDFEPVAYFAVPALPRKEQKGLELAHLLLASAEMIGNEQYDRAARMLRQCESSSSQFGNPIERLAYYFSEALQMRIERETLGMLKKPWKALYPDHFAQNLDTNHVENEFYGLIAFYSNVLPHIKVLQFTSVQAIVDAVGNAKKIHVIDLGIRTGCQWTVLIQSLALRGASSSSLDQLLTITAVGKNVERLKHCGRKLSEFAKSFAVPFSYKIVEISKMEEIKEGLFDVKSGEALAVYAPTVLRNLLYDPVALHNLVNVIRKLRPRIMVNAEVEAQHNSSSFVKRFVEVLFYYSPYFDMLEVVSAHRNDMKRVKFEEMFYGIQIRNMIACEGKNRKVRHVGMDTWRRFFKQTGFKEMRLSYQAWYQARLLLNKLPHGDCFTVEPNGSAITVTWKGNPLYTLSTWTCM